MTIRCIQIGGLDGPIIQGHATATWVEDCPHGPEARGAILSMGRVMMGRLIPQNPIPQKQARYGAEELEAIKEWMAGQ